MKISVYLTCILLCLAALRNSVHAGCTPTGVFKAEIDDNSTTAGTDITEGTTVTGKARSRISERHTGSSDSGRAKRTEIKKPQSPDVTLNSKSCLELGTYAYVWAEDGDTKELQYTEQITRDWEFSTKCSDAGGHDAPFGGNTWLVKCYGHFNFSVTANGHSDAGFSRAISATMSAKMLTGRTVKVTHKVEDNPEHESRTVHAALSGSLGDEKEVGAGADAKKNVDVRLKSARKNKVSGTIDIESRTEWIANAAVSYTDDISFSDAMCFDTLCHGAKETHEERTSISVAYTVTAPNWTMSSNEMYIQGDYYVKLCTVVQERKYRECGAAAPVIYEADWKTIAVGDQVEAGRHGARNTLIAGGPSPALGVELVPFDSRLSGIAFGPDGACRHDVMLFHLHIHDAEAKEVFVQAGPSCAGVLAVSSVWAKSVEGALTTLSLGVAGWQGLLPAGNYIVYANVLMLEPGVAYVEGRLEPDGECAEACIENIHHVLTPAQWELGVHSSASTASPLIWLGNACDIIVLQDLLPDGIALSQLALTVDAGAVSWEREPELVHDAASGRWLIRMWPVASADFLLTLTYMGEYSFTVPVRFVVSE